MYTRKSEPICKQFIFKKLLYKLTTECTFSATGKLRKEVDGVSMGGTFSVILSDCFMTKIEIGIVLSLQPKLYRQFVKYVRKYCQVCSKLDIIRLP